MFCPNCSEPKQIESTQYCAKCGLDLNNLKSFVTDGGTSFGRSRRRKGIEQGVILIMVGILLIPVWMFIPGAFPPDDRLVESAPSTTWPEQIAWILMWIAFLAGAARILFEFAFESVRSSVGRAEPEETALDSHGEYRSLPSGDTFRPVPHGSWKTTNDLIHPILRSPRTSGDL